MTHYSFLLALFEGAEVSEDLKGGAPSLELILPVQHHRGRYDDEVRPPVPTLDGEVGQEGNGLDGLPQTHLVC